MDDAAEGDGRIIYQHAEDQPQWCPAPSTVLTFRKHSLEKQSVVRNDFYLVRPLPEFPA